MSKIDQSDKNDIKEILDKIIYNWEWMMSKGRKLSEIKIDVANIRHKIDDNNPVRH